MAFDEEGNSDRGAARWENFAAKTGGGKKGSN